jgi:hypothetical protein
VRALHFKTETVDSQDRRIRWLSPNKAGRALEAPISGDQRQSFAEVFAQSYVAAGDASSGRPFLRYSMFWHIFIGVGDFERAFSFYSVLAGPLS